MLQKIVNKILDIFGVSKPYDFPKMSRTAVLSVLDKEYKAQEDKCAMIERVLNKNLNIETVIVTDRNVKAFRIKNTDVNISLLMLVSSDLYKHCQYYGINEFKGFKIEKQQ